MLFKCDRSHLLSESSMKRSSSSQKCSGIPSDSISAKLSPSTWPTQGWATELLVSFHPRRRSRFDTSLQKNPKNKKTNTYNFCEEPLRDGLHGPAYLDADPVACFVLPKPVAALVQTVEPLQSWPSVGEHSRFGVLGKRARAPRESLQLNRLDQCMLQKK